jgi:hypothetical protein
MILMAKTIVIKSEATASAMNVGLNERGLDVDEDAPATWKYYLNLSGRYHSTDTPMTVTSLDTREEISFDVQTLSVHRRTLRDYAFGTRFYDQLVARYPAQRDLIHGILNPVDINAAIAAPDGKILYIDQFLIEENETSLVSQIQDRIDAFMLRYNVAEFVMVDDLYPAAHLAILFLNIPLFIEDARLTNCHTEQVHSFHIRQYLASHGRLDAYISHLDKEQMLFLYRNILYIQRNAGKQDTFEWLIDKIMSHRMLPVAEFNLHHNVSEQPGNLYPTVEVKRVDLTRFASGNPIDTFSVTEIVNRAAKIAPGNYDQIPATVAEVTEKMTNSSSNRLKTKMLESSVVDRSNDYALTFSDVLLNHWLYFAQEGWYKTIISFDNPLTGDQLWYNAKDAFILFIYAMNRALGQNLVYVPNPDAVMVRKQFLPTREDLRKITEVERVPDDVLDALLKDQPVLNDLVSVEAFYDKCKEIHLAWKEHNWIYTSQEHYESRGQAEAAALHLYQNKNCQLDNGTQITYDQWLQEHQLDVTNFSKAEFELLYTNLLALTTGTSLHVTVSLAELQAAMIRLLTQLSSYSVQFLSELRGTNMLSLNWSAIRLGDQVGDGSGDMHLHQTNVYVQNMDGVGQDKIEETLDNATFEMTNNAGEHGDSGKWDHTVNFAADGYSKFSMRLTIPTVYFSMPEAVPLELDDIINQQAIPEYLYLAMPPVNIGEYKHIRTALVIPQLDGFDYAPTTDIPWEEITVNGFDYPVFDETALALVQPNGFDYSPSPVPTMVLADTLDGFTYEIVPPHLELTAVQDGFDYTPPEGELTVSPTLSGFEYEPVQQPLLIAAESDGLDYPEPPPALAINDVGLGFDYKNTERRLNLIPDMGGLDYPPSPDQLVLNPQLVGFTYATPLADVILTTRQPGLVLQRLLGVEASLLLGLSLNPPD